jgi:DNA-binding CsgD family transcriptional regulator
LSANEASSREAAALLLTGEATVKAHHLHIYAKFGVATARRRSSTASTAAC